MRSDLLEINAGFFQADSGRMAEYRDAPMELGPPSAGWSQGARLSELPPVILIASASAYERRRIRGKVAPTGWLVQDVSSAEEAARFCDGNRKAVILLIDGGLLAQTASPEWRAMRERYPEVGAVVRSLIPRGGGILRPDPFTILVHPEDSEGLQEALRLLKSPLDPPRRRGTGARAAAGSAARTRRDRERRRSRSAQTPPGRS